MIQYKKQTVVVLGASDKPERYSNKAIQLLKENGHTVIPVNPRLKQVEGLDVVHDLDDINVPVDTLAIYVSPKITNEVLYNIVDMKPKRVIFNPGTESTELEKALERECIPYHRACVLVLLNTGQF